MPRISILMANYNKAEYISAAIRSVLVQTFTDWELIIVDDSSSDSSLLLISNFLPDEKIKLIRNKENLGYTQSLKIGINNTSAEILVILDSDDAITPDALAEIDMAYRQYPEAGFVYSQCWYCDEKLKLKHIGYSAFIPEGKSNLQTNSVVAIRTFKKKYYMQIGGYDADMVFAEDIDLTLRIEEVTRLFFLDKPLYYYRVLKKSQTHSFINEHTNRSFTALAKYRAFKRRLGTMMPNLRIEEATSVLFFGMISSIFSRRWRLARYFIREIYLTNKFFFLNYKFYNLFVKKFIKFLRLRYG
jgi:glycosyltransferase involved in cell wall biosynthesis